MYKRVLVKISGEQLAGKHSSGIDTDIAKYFALEVKKVVDAGCKVIIVVGGGNIVRGATVAGNGIKRVTADHMGMLAVMINALALTDIFEEEGIQTRCLSNIFAEQVIESYSYRRAIKHLEADRVLIIAGGVGRPYFSTDTGSVNLALELDADVVIKTTKVAGVYTKDPVKYPDAKLLPTMTFQQAVEDNGINVMDKAALGLAMEQGMPLIVLRAMDPDNILKAVKGEPIGTSIG